jgi:hypothetical protein
MSKFSTRILILALIVLVSIVGGVIAIYTTANGPWGYTDPVEYISVARSLDRGLGLAYYEGNAVLTPETIHPPLYSLILGLVGLSGVNLVAASRWLNILAFVASIFIAGWIFYRYSRVPAVGLIASILMCAFPHMVWMFSSSYSEPLFVLSILAGGWGLLAYLRSEKWTSLTIGAIAVGTIPGTRYAGIAMVISAGLTVLLFASGVTWSRIKKAILFTAVAGLPVFAWLVWVYFSSAHSLGGRIPDLNLAGFSAQFQAFRGIFMDTVWKWVPFQSHETLLGYRLRFVLMGIFAVALFTVSILAYRRYKKDTFDRDQDFDLQIFAFFGISALAFVTVLVLTYLFTYPTIDIDNRMLLPLYVISVMMIYGALALWQAAWFKGKLRVLQAIPWILAALCVYWYYPQTIDIVKYFRKGDGLTAYRWNDAAIIQAVRALPASQPVISNDWELTMLWTGRPVYGFWTEFPSEPPIQTTTYGTNPEDDLQALFCDKGAALVVYIDFPTQFRNQVGESELGKLPGLFAGLTVIGQYADGTIYVCH